MLTEKDYCDYETCVALKELGYVGICDAYYELTGTKEYNRDSFEILYTREFIHPDDIDRVAAPLLYQAQKWLREEKGVIVEVFVDDDSDTPITYNIHKDGECVCHHHGKYWSVKEWSDALSEGVRASIKILQDEQKENN